MTVIINAIGVSRIVGFEPENIPPFENDEISSKVKDVVEKELKKQPSGLSKALEKKEPLEELKQKAAGLEQSIKEQKKKVEQDELDESFSDSSFTNPHYEPFSSFSSPFSDPSFEESLHKKLEELKFAQSFPSKKLVAPELSLIDSFGFFPGDGELLKNI
ncbi:MAG: hypothetical protein K940chlam6_01552 [Chlamydiae bacterium]|nr:hypothetical protein [Chlamydiota bacterium]